MIYTTKIQKAINYAIDIHEIKEKQKRKGKDIPYITHPLTVGLILAQAGASESVIAAGILHDVIEDGINYAEETGDIGATFVNNLNRNVMLEDLGINFGSDVESAVRDVTEFKGFSWEVRKKDMLKRIETFSHDSLLVKSADIISNMSELLDDYQKDGEKVFDRFNAAKERLLENTYCFISAICKQWPESPLAEVLLNIKDRLVDIEDR